MSYAPARKNAPYVFYVGLASQADTRLAQVNPTIAAGDFKVSVDGGALANLASLPVVTPAGSRMVKISLSAEEMNGDNITVVASDAAGAEWCDEVWNIQTQTDSIVLQTLTMGLKADMRAKFEELKVRVDAKVETLRIAVLDLQQAILRGKG